jgi:hypothetical protein
VTAIFWVLVKPIPIKQLEAIRRAASGTEV